MRDFATVNNSAVAAYEFVVLRVGEEPFFFRPKNPRLVLGRDSGCDIPLNSPAISRQHAKLHFEDGCWQVIDLGSSNGTFLGESAIQPKVVTIWKAGDPLRLGPFTIQQHKAHQAGKTPTLFLQPLNEISKTLSHFVASLDSETITLQPAQRKTAQLTTRNHSDEVVRLKVMIRNLSADWYELSNNEILLHPNTRKQTLIRFDVPEGAERGIHPFEIDVKAANSAEKVTVYGMLDVTQQVFHAFSADLAYKNNRLFLSMSNSGNVDDAYKISLQSNPAVSVVGHQWSSILKAEQSDTIQFNVVPRRPLIGATKECPVGMTIRSNSGIERHAQTFVLVKPVLPLWGIAIIGVLLVLTILGLALGWF